MLNRNEIRQLVIQHELVSEYIDLEKQLQPSGFDISLQNVHVFTSSGSVDFSNEEREISTSSPLKPDFEGWWWLPKGCYKIIYNEIVKMPLDVSAIARTRSTLLRNGASIQTAVWDPGYRGRSSSLLVVYNPDGIRLKRDARIAQLIFFNIKNVEEGYIGKYQNERIPKKGD